MQDEQLKNTDSEDIGDVLKQIETSFAIKFGFYELQHTRTLGELCDIIESKILLTNITDCTSQQAFYKLRTALEVSTGIAGITPDSSLLVVLPRRKRQIIWRAVERQLGFKLGIIGVSSTVVTVLVFAFVASLLAFLISAKVAGLSLLVCFAAAFLAGETGNTLQARTVRECVKKMTREQYVKSRRNSGTFNRQEIFRQVQAIFMEGLFLPVSALSREATFV